MPVTEASHRERGQSLPADVIEVVVRDCLDLRHCLETLFRFEALDGMMRLGRFLPGRSLRMDRAGGGRCGGRAKQPQPEIGESDKPQLGGEGEVSELMQSMRIGLIDLRDSLRAMGRPMRVVAVPAVPGMQAVPLKKPGQGRPARHAQVNTSSRGEHDQQAPKPEEAGDSYSPTRSARDHGTQENEYLSEDGGESFSCTGPAWSASCWLGQI
jgi:hypothetical protein